MEKILRRAEKYFSRHTSYNALIHAVAGIGIGFLLAYPVAQTHPVRWGVAFLALGVLGHLWAMR